MVAARVRRSARRVQKGSIVSFCIVSFCIVFFCIVFNETLRERLQAKHDFSTGDKTGHFPLYPSPPQLSASQQRC